MPRKRNRRERETREKGEGRDTEKEGGGVGDRYKEHKRSRKGGERGGREGGKGKQIRCRLHWVLIKRGTYRRYIYIL